MLKFEDIVKRHGEAAAQALLENLERFEGVRPNSATSLEKRWEKLMASADDRRIAA